MSPVGRSARCLWRPRALVLVAFWSPHPVMSLPISTEHISTFTTSADQSLPQMCTEMCEFSGCAELLPDQQCPLCLMSTAAQVEVMASCQRKGACLIHREQHVDKLQHTAIASIWYYCMCQNRQQIWVVQLCHNFDFFLCCCQLFTASGQYLQPYTF